MTSLILYFAILLASVSWFYYYFVLFSVLFKAGVDCVPNCNATSRVYFKHINNFVRL